MIEELKARMERVRKVADGGTINGTYRALPMDSLIAFRADLSALLSALSAVPVMKEAIYSPTQEDREWAKALLDASALGGSGYHFVEAVMFHRLAAEERGARMALEAAAKVAEDMAMVLPIEECCVLHGDLVIAAIRQIDPAALKGAE